MKIKVSIPALLFFVFVVTNGLNAQNYKAIEKFKYKLSKETNDTNVISLYGDLFWEYYGVYNDTALIYAKKAIEYAQKKDFKFGLTEGYRMAGMAYSELANFPQALQHEQMALKLCDSSNLERKANILNNLANIYYELKDYNTALNYYQASLDICTRLDFTLGISSCLGNMGNIYKKLKKYDASLKYYQRSAKIDRAEKNQRGYANSMVNIGDLYLQKKEYAKALNYFEQSLQIRDSLGLTEGVTSSYLSLGTVYNAINQPEKALDYFTRALNLAEESGTLDQMQSSYNGLSVAYKKLGRTAEALEAFEKYDQLKDSILNDERADEINQLKTSYLIEQRETELRIENEKANAKTQAENEADKRQQWMIIYFSIGGLVLLIIFLYFIFKRYKFSLRQQDIIQAQKKIVEVKNKEITDSINYAKRIQEAMLTSEGEFCRHFKRAFVLFRPKDIVSGDFYWSYKIPGTNKVIYVLGDCTGHGVPGGFMSVLGINLMNEVVNERQVHEPAEILEQLRIRIKSALKQDGGDGTSRDGMDVTVGKLDLDTGKFTYATANRMLYIHNGENLQRYNGNKMPVGYYENEEKFLQYDVQLKKGDLVYFFTDGFVDQIGGEQGRKLKYGNFETAIHKAIAEGHELDKHFFDRVFIEWKKNHHQVDDVSLVGVEV